MIQRDEPKERIPLTFAAGTADLRTKADINFFVPGSAYGEDLLPVGGKVGLFGYYTGTGSWTPYSISNYFYNQPLVCVDESIAGSFDNRVLSFSDANEIKYWPGESDENLSFFAYYPYPDGSNKHGISFENTQALASSGKGQGVFSFSTEERGEDQVDFMISEMCRPQYGETVQLKFRHALTQIVINPPVPAQTTKIEIKGIYLNGETCPAFSEGTDYTANWPTWSLSGSLGNVAADYTSDIRQHIFLLIPQSIPTGASIVITTDEGEQSFPIDNLDLKEWKAGVRYTYEFSGGHIIVNSNELDPSKIPTTPGMTGHVFVIDSRAKAKELYDDLTQRLTDGENMYVAVYFTVTEDSGAQSRNIDFAIDFFQQSFYKFESSNATFAAHEEFYTCIPIQMEHLEWLGDAIYDRNGRTWQEGQPNNSMFRVKCQDIVSITKLYVVDQSYHDLTTTYMPVPRTETFYGALNTTPTVVTTTGT